jgi:hypothetical protein
MSKHVKRPGADRTVKLRPCMACKGIFRSTGAHHRMCDRCRTGSLTVFDIDHAIRR